MKLKTIKINYSKASPVGGEDGKSVQEFFDVVIKVGKQVARKMVGGMDSQERKNMAIALFDYEKSKRRWKYELE